MSESRHVADVVSGSARARVQAVLDAHTDLSCEGFRAHRRGRDVAVEAAEFNDNRVHLLTDTGVRQVEKCLAYLALVRKTRSARPAADRSVPSSYGLKHAVERWLRQQEKHDEDCYISNGAFIAAALIAGFPPYRTPEMSLNCLVGVSNEDRAAVDNGKDPREWRKTTASVRWLFTQADRGDPVGDLAGAAKADFDFPRRGNIAAIRSYLSQYGDHVQEAFATARLEYRAKAASTAMEPA